MMELRVESAQKFTSIRNVLQYMVCIEFQYESLKGLKREIQSLLKPQSPHNLAGWKSYARSQERMVDAILTMIKTPSTAFYFEFQTLASLGHLSRSPNLVDKGMRLYKESIEQEKFSLQKKKYENQERKLKEWRHNLRSRKTPDLFEITSLKRHFRKQTYCPVAAYLPKY